MSYYVMPRVPIGPPGIESKTSGIRHIVRSCCRAVALLNKEHRRQYFDNEGYRNLAKYPRN